MSNGAALMLGQITLGMYALLLMAGGAIGFLKAGSRPSLIAGVSSGLMALACLGLTFSRPVAGFWAGVVLASLMAVVFAIRLRKTGKFMPSGMLLGMSAVAAVLLAAGAWNFR